MTHEEVVEKLNAFLVTKMEVNPADLLPEADVKEDLGMSSMDMMETIIFIKKTFGFRPARGVLHHLFTLEDWYDYIETNALQ